MMVRKLPHFCGYKGRTEKGLYYIPSFYVFSNLKSSTSIDIIKNRS